MARPDILQRLSDEISADTAAIPSFAPGIPIRLRSAPARVDVLGGLGADAGGTLALMAGPLRNAVALQPADRPFLTARSPLLTPAIGMPLAEFALDEDPPADMPGTAWAAPLASLARMFRRLHPAAPPGYRMTIRGDIPPGAGQGSSTAILVAMLLAMSDLANVVPDPTQGALLIRDAAHHAGAPAGNARVIDALTSLLAGASPPAPRADLLRFNAQPHQFIAHVPLPAHVRVLAMDTGIRHAAAPATLDELRIAGAMGFRIIETIYRDLGQAHTPLHGYLANTSPLLYRQYFRTLLPKRMRAADFARAYGPLPPGPDAASGFYRVRTAVDHLIAEHEHAEQFLQAMEELADGLLTDDAERTRTLQRAGRLLLASHHSYRLRLELSCREADWLVDRLMAYGPDRGVYGARITGCGGGGTVVALVEGSPRAGDAVLDVIRAYPQFAGPALAVTELGGRNATGALHTPGRTIQTPT